MDMSNYVQPNCVNGVTKEDAENVKDIPQIKDDLDTLNSKVDGIEDDIEILDNRVTTLEENSGSKDWELYDGTDWSQFSTDGKANQELLLRIVSTPKWTVSSSSNHLMKVTGIEVHLKKGDTFSNTDIEDNDTVFPIFDGSLVSTYYYSALGQGKFITKGVSGNTNILTSTTVKIKIEGAVLYISSTSSSITSSQILGKIIENDMTLTKNGTGTTNLIFLYYRLQN